MSQSPSTSPDFTAWTFVDKGVNTDVEMLLESLDYHRNGVSGAGFWAVLFKSREVYKGMRDPDRWRNMVGVLFDSDEVTHPKACAILDRDDLAKGIVKFGVNSWRGDRYVEGLRFFVAAVASDGAGS